ncbi:MAG: RNA 2',3'-cyclic phosphodiesterase [Acidobacteria bacterium]|nr:MAG: RNA 2',3'-cyclic phosphodiesterase [Acidobacteriota bacterium]
MRLFVALDIDEAIQQRLADYVRALQPKLPGVRFVGRNTYHITLKFLGEVQNERAVREQLRKVRAAAFDLTVSKVGFFPSARAPRVFWAGIQAPSALAELAHGIGMTLETLGFPQEREFSPHLTLARNGSGRPRSQSQERSPAAFAQLARIVASSPEPEFGTMTAQEFFLYESKLSSSGPSYYKLEGYKLAN